MAIEGTLDELRLPDILQTVAQQRKTGILTIQGDETIVAVSFLAGRVVTADSLEETVEERLGRLLQRDGLVDRSTFSGVAARADAGEGRLADLLVGEGLLTREQLLGGLRAQTLELLHDLVGWRRGEFKFYAGDQVSYEEGFEPISVEDLLLGWLDDPALAEPAPATTEPAAGPRRLDSSAPWTPPAAPPSTAGVPDPMEATLSGIEAFPPPAEAIPEVAAEKEWTDALEEAEEEAAEEPAAEVEAGPVRVPAGWAPALATVLAVGLIGALLLAPGRFLLPFPWQRPERTALADVQAQAAHLVIDRAAKTFFLLEGRFPDSLSRLVALGLLDGGEVRDAAGDPFLYTPHADSYELASPSGEETGGARSEAITGNFLLDPELLTAPQPASAEPPLVLLD